MLEKKRLISFVLTVVLVLQTVGMGFPGAAEKVLAASAEVDGRQTVKTEFVEAENAILGNPSDFERDADSASNAGGHLRTKVLKATVSLTFTGTGIKFFTKKGSGAGSLQVTVDGIPCGEADEYVPGAAEFKSLVFEKMDLSEQNEEHTIVLTTASPKPHHSETPWYNFDYFEVYSLEGSAEGELIKSPGDTAYYVDSNAQVNGNGLSSDTPFNTLDEINKREFAPGDMIYLKSGSSFQGQLYLKGSGSEEKPIRVNRYGDGLKPLIDGRGRNGKTPSYGDNGPFGAEGSAVYLLNSQYWEISNLSVTNWSDSAASTERSGIRVEAYGGGIYRHIYIRDCEVFDVRGFRAQDCIWEVQPVGGGSSFYGSRTTHRTGGINLCTYTKREDNRQDKTNPGTVLDEKPTTFDDILIEGNTIRNCDANGITTTNVKGSLDDKAYRHTNVVIRRNVIENVQRAGIIPLYTSGALVEHNKIDTFQQTTEGYGCGIWCDRADNMVFQYNEVCNGKNTMDGMAFNLDDMTENGLIQYNYTHDNVGGGYMLHIRTNSYNRNNTIRYNLSVNDTYNYAAHQAIIVCVGEDANTKIESAKVYNNTFFNTRSVHPVYKGDQIDFSNNIFYLVNQQLKNKNDAYILGAKTTFKNNLFAGVHPKNEPSGNLSLAKPGLAGALVTDTADGFLGKSKEDALLSAKLAFASVALGSGAVIENNGGEDLYGNPVSSADAPNIGAYNGEVVEKFEPDDFVEPDEDNGEPSEFDDYNSIYVEGEDAAVKKTGAFTTAASAAHGGSHINSRDEGAEVEYTFTGIAFSVYTKTGSGAGVADIYLDGQKVASDDQYSSEEIFDRLAYTQSFEQTGTHTVRIVRTGTSNPSATGSTLNFDCFKIFQEKEPVRIEGTLIKLDDSKFTASAESVEEKEGPANNAIDGKADTYWHSNYSNDAMAPKFSDNFKNDFTINLGDSFRIQKLEYLPRQGGSSNGTILKYKLYYSNGTEGEFKPVPRGIGKWDADSVLKYSLFEAVQARRLQIRVFESVSDNAGKDLISAAEFSVYGIENKEPEEKVQIQVIAQTGGRAEGGGSVDKGREVTLTAEANTGYHFAGWYLNEQKVSEELRYTVKAEADAVYTAKFEKNLPIPQTPPAKTEGLNGVSTAKQIKLSWNPAAGADGYEIQYKQGKVWKTLKTLSETKFTHKGLKTAATYSYRILAYKNNGSTKLYGPASKILKTATAPVKTTIKVKNRNKNSLVLEWKRVAGANGYLLEKKIGKGKYKPAGFQNAKRKTCTISGIKKVKTYYFRIKAYKKAGGKRIYAAPAVRKIKIK